VKLKAESTPPAENVHEAGPEITVVDVGLEIPNVPEIQEGMVIASAGAKPLPETVTTVPSGPDVGLSVIVGKVPVTVSVAWATSPTGSPVT